MTDHPDKQDMDPSHGTGDDSTRGRLGFREMVPSCDAQSPAQEQPDRAVSIPEFDLGRQMMARHRQDTALRRKSPKQQAKARIPPLDRVEPEPPPESAQIEAHPGFVWTTYASPTENALIAEIVSRDIQRLCRVGRARRR